MMFSCKHSPRSEEGVALVLAAGLEAEQGSAHGSVCLEAGGTGGRAHSSAHDFPAHVERELEDALSGLYAAIWSIGELLGTPIGGWLLGVLPPTVELNCSSRPHMDKEECTWSFHNTMLVFVLVIFVCAGFMLLDSLRIRRYLLLRRPYEHTQTVPAST